MCIRDRLNGPHTSLERLIQTPAVRRQNPVSTRSPRNAPTTNSHSRSAALRGVSPFWAMVGSCRLTAGVWMSRSSLAVSYTHLGGRINLLYCFFWGMAAVVWMRYGYPVVMKCMTRLQMCIRDRSCAKVIFFGYIYKDFVNIL